MADRALSWQRAGAIAWRDLKSAPGKFGFVVLSVAVGVTDTLSMPSFQSIVPSIVEHDQIASIDRSVHRRT